MVKSRDLTTYFQHLNRALACPKAVRADFLSDAKRMADDFIQGKPDATQQEVEDFLGDPSELARSFLDDLDPTVLAQYRTTKTRTRRALIALAIVIALAAGTWIAYLRMHPINMDVSETLIIYEEGKAKRKSRFLFFSH